jgi:hypothetical protein
LFLENLVVERMSVGAVLPGFFNIQVAIFAGARLHCGMWGGILCDWRCLR